jgi:hypothetical protein
MKNILKILFLIGLSGNFLIAAKMYKLPPEGTYIDEFSVSSFFSSLDDAYLVVGVTTEPTVDNETDVWILSDAKLNPVFKLNTDFMDENSITEASAGDYYLAARTVDSAGIESKTYKKVVLTETPHEQYTGQPLFMLYDALPSHTTDYKGTNVPTGEVALRFFPVLDLAQFSDAGGAYFDYHFKIEGETTWNKCNTIKKGSNGAVSTEAEVFGDLTDHLPVETVWDAKTDLGTDFNYNIVVRIRAKYGTAAFTTAPTDSGSTSPSPGSGETYALTTGGTIIDVLDAEATADLDDDGGIYANDKILEVIQNNGLVSVGTYDDGMYTYDVFDFPVAALSAFTNGAEKPAGTYAIKGSQLLEAYPLAPASGS